MILQYPFQMLIDTYVVIKAFIMYLSGDFIVIVGFMISLNDCDQ